MWGGVGAPKCGYTPNSLLFALVFPQAVAPYYHLVAAGCRHNLSFCNAILGHRNWDWAIIHMYLNSAVCKRVCLCLCVTYTNAYAGAIFLAVAYLPGTPSPHRLFTSYQSPWPETRRQPENLIAPALEFLCMARCLCRLSVLVIRNLRPAPWET